MKNSVRLLACAGLVSVCLCACKDTDLFVEDTYIEQVRASFPVKGVDPGQRWSTTGTTLMRVTVRMGRPGSYTVKVFSQQPDSAGAAGLLACGSVAGGQTLVTAVSYPLSSPLVYVAVADSAGVMTVCPAPVSGGETALEVGDAAAGSRPLAACRLSPAEAARLKAAGTGLTYCYEDNFPAPGDCDFNDVVMGLQLEKRHRRAGAQCDTLVARVGLRAVGSLKPIAAALRLKGVSAACVGGTFGLEAAPGRPSLGFYDIERYNTLLHKGGDDGRSFLTALDGQDVVIPLFNDAHYAISGGEKEEGDAKRRYYNTKAAPGAGGETVAEGRLPASVYTLYFRDSAAFARFAPDKADLFIIEEFNGACYEVHTLAFKQDEVVHRWREGSTAYADNFPWAIAVPGVFSYPVEGTPIGSSPISNVLGGAYQTRGHSFGEWARDCSKAADWYGYPRAGLVCPR